MATINGDNGDNVLNGTEDEDTINGLGGNDTIDSVDRPANIFAGSINPVRDEVRAGSGDDTVTGGKLDRLVGGEGNDSLSVNFNFNGPVAGSATPIRLTLNENGTGRASDGTVIYGFESVNFNLSDTGDNVVDTGNVRAQLTGGNGNDTLTTGSADDVVSGGGGDNVISTGGGNDTIGGGSGIDTVFGGDGDDTFGVSISTDGSDQVNLGDGNDTVRFDRADGGAGNVRLTFTSAEVGNGNTNDAGSLTNQDGGLAVRVQAEDADGNLTGPISRYDDEGITFVAGTQGITFDVRDLVSGTQRGNTFEGVVLGTDGDDALTFFPPFRAGQDFYYNAGQGNDTITAGTGNDFLVGGAGDDTMIGGLGNDSYIVDSLGDTVVEGADEGTDTVLSSITYTLPDTIENLVLTGMGAVDGTGNALDNSITGNIADNRLDGGAGNDRLTGGAGNDVLQGGVGDDILQGGAGDDVYAVDGAGDQVIELAGEGNDTVRSSVSYTVSDHVENLVLRDNGDLSGSGNDLDNRITGNDGDNRLSGGAGDDTLVGRDGDDTLLGGTGADALIGGAGSDTYVIDNAGDRALEQPGQGFDTVRSSVSHTMETNIEKLVLYGSDDLTANGNVGRNQIYGNAGDNAIYGDDGRDLLFGRDGADTFVFKAITDSDVAVSGRDIIKDFGFAEGDRIDLSGIDADFGQAGDQGFQFVGTDAFSGQAGELRTKFGGGNTLIQGDTNGDGAADFAVLLQGHQTLDNGSFVV
ncbi:calcium-binding protein [Methylobacterium sp. SD274]|uniref:calcium-binding protein n=1 Tax=Methylobacterium sp. SD274 TaxID=2782009 RepID=UPI001A95FCA0|nr:calcium-binding protein [Methylobacterium sp. SD274]MBO1022362.1 calcium-binding protein [Methylobacterium sp. SD274]